MLWRICLVTELLVFPSPCKRWCFYSVSIWILKVQACPRFSRSCKTFSSSILITDFKFVLITKVRRPKLFYFSCKDDRESAPYIPCSSPHLCLSVFSFPPLRQLRICLSFFLYFLMIIIMYDHNLLSIHILFLFLFTTKLGLFSMLSMRDNLHFFLIDLSIIYEKMKNCHVSLIF
jgi:hypothetical protein